MTRTATIHIGDALDVLRTLPAESAHCCVTSPPYYGLRDYGVAGQFGLEPTPDEYVARLVDVFAEVRRVLRDDGTLWLNVGDSYCTTPRGNRDGDLSTSSLTNPQRQEKLWGKHAYRSQEREPRIAKVAGCKPKDLIGIPWMLAFALRADGWFLRSEIIWAKPNPMPESVTDRPTKAHETVFLLSKSRRYYYDAEAIEEPVAESTVGRLAQDIEAQNGSVRAHGGIKVMKSVGGALRRNARSVWTIATQPFTAAHFAVMPPALAERCILAGSPAGGTVIDPFGGAGTSGVVALGHGRDAVLIDLNGAYMRDIAAPRIRAAAPLYNRVDFVASAKREVPA